MRRWTPRSRRRSTTRLRLPARVRFRSGRNSAGTCSPDRSLHDQSPAQIFRSHPRGDRYLPRARPQHLSDGAGRARPHRCVRHDQGAAGKARQEARVRHAGGGERHERRCARLVPGGNAADHDPHAARIRHDRDGSNLQSGGEMALHVRRPIQGAADDPHARRPRLGAGAAALPEPACVVCAYSWSQGGHAVDALRRQGTAHRQHRGRQPRHLLRTPLAA